VILRASNNRSKITAGPEIPYRAQRRDVLSPMPRTRAAGRFEVLEEGRDNALTKKLDAEIAPSCLYGPCRDRMAYWCDAAQSRNPIGVAR